MAPTAIFYFFNTEHRNWPVDLSVAILFEFLCLSVSPVHINAFLSLFPSGSPDTCLVYWLFWWSWSVHVLLHRWSNTFGLQQCSATMVNCGLQYHAFHKPHSRILWHSFASGRSCLRNDCNATLHEGIQR